MGTNLYGDWELMCEDSGEKNKYNVVLSVFKCKKCGNEKLIHKSYFYHHNNMKCEKCTENYLQSFINKQFGYLNVVSYSHKNEKSHHFYNCKCICGKELKVILNNLINSNNPSCGCMKNITHGMTNTRFYKIWISMKNRCYNCKDDNYYYYGARGIQICNEWYVDFNNFYNDMYNSYINHCNQFGEKDTTLDRIDVDDNYYKDNCRWATIIEQSNNRRNNIYVYIYGIYMTLMQISRFFNISYTIIRNSYYNGNIYEFLNKSLIAKNEKTEIIRFL
jgi:hypothetical protein